MSNHLKTRAQAADSRAPLILVLGLAACRNDLETVADFEILGGPSQVLVDATLEYSEQGLLTHRLAAGRMTRSSEEPPVWEVENRFTLDVLDSAGHLDASLGADQGQFAEESRFLVARGNVVLRGSEGDTLFTELLYWSADSNLVHTPAAVEVRTPQGTLLGKGLESDASFEEYRILQPTGIFLVDTARAAP